MIPIERVVARQILDSRGNPTIEVDVVLQDGSLGRAAVPSGASTGTYEALELRDGTPHSYPGRFVRRAVDNVNNTIGPAIIGRNLLEQGEIDKILIDLDGTPNKGSLGANALLGVSLACARASAHHLGVPLYRYLQPREEYILPVPLMNVLNGGRHAEDSVDFQEFMLVPFGFPSFSEALWAGAEVYWMLRGELKARGLGTGLGDEGGFAPTLSSNNQAVELLLGAIEKAGYNPRTQIGIALDVAANELFNEEKGLYELNREGRALDSEGMISLYEKWLDDYPAIVSIEDGLGEDDWEGWRRLTTSLGSRVQLVGDDLFVTNLTRLKRGIKERCANAILIKLNQIGTLTETLQTMQMARSAGLNCVVSHRSGETGDDFMCDLAVATGAGQVKAGAPARGERVEKYNRLLRIEEQLGRSGRFLGSRAFL